MRRVRLQPRRQMPIYKWVGSPTGGERRGAQAGGAPGAVRRQLRRSLPPRHQADPVRWPAFINGNSPGSCHVHAKSHSSRAPHTTSCENTTIHGAGSKHCRGAVRLYSEFLQSDVIVASPLGLTTLLTEAAGAGDAGAADFLTSIEIAVVARADVLLMQNWMHVTEGRPSPANG